MGEEEGGGRGQEGGSSMREEVKKGEEGEGWRLRSWEEEEEER